MGRRSDWAARIEAGLGRVWWQGEAPIAAQCLRPLSWCYGAVVWLRSTAFAVGLGHRRKAPLPLVVVGNLVVGGAGKTPTVLAVVKALQASGFRPGVISRGHGRQGSGVREVLAESPVREVGDEPLMMRLRSGAPVFVAARRIDAALALCAAHPRVDVLVADDGLQHLALHRDAQIVVLDERGVGNGLLLPAGPLRQPLPATLPDATQVLYNAGRASTALPGTLVQRSLGGAVSLHAWWDGQAATLAQLVQLRGRPLMAAAGIASPRRFFDMLRDHGLAFAELPLSDHHDFATLPWPAGTADVLVTEKDAVKLQPAAQGATRVWVVTLDFLLPDPFLDLMLDHLGLTHAHES